MTRRSRDLVASSYQKKAAHCAASRFFRQRKSRSTRSRVMSPGKGCFMIGRGASINYPRIGLLYRLGGDSSSQLGDHPADYREQTAQRRLRRQIRLCPADRKNEQLGLFKSPQLRPGNFFAFSKNGISNW